MSNVMQTAREMWPREPGKAVVYARLNREGMPRDLYERVMRRNDLVRRQAEQLRTERDINNRVNTAMAIVTGAMAQPMALGMPAGDMPDPIEMVFEAVMAFCTIPIPPSSQVGAHVVEAAEACLLGRTSGTAFLASVVAPAHRVQVEQGMKALIELCAQSPHLAPLVPLFQVMPVIVCAVVVPDDRLAVLAAELGVN